MSLPTWAGASSAYSRAYRTLERMARNGHVSKRHVSEEMHDLIEALNEGNEERIKGLLLHYTDRGF